VSETNSAVRIEDVSPVKKKIAVEIAWPDVKQELDDVFRKIGKTAKIKGFRQGKIPRPVLERFYKEYAEEETINNLVNRYFWKAVEDQKVVPLSQPQIDQQGIVSESPFAFSATIEVEPVIDPKDYLGLNLERQEMEVADSDVDSRLRQLQEMYSTMEEVTEKRTVVAGDFVTIDFQGFVEGKPRKDMQSENYLLEIGSRSFIPGFEDQVVGMNVDEEKEIALNFPADYQEKSLAGKEAVFKVVLKGLKEKKLPELNEDFIKNFDKYEKFADLRADILKAIGEENRERANADLRTAMIKNMIEKNPFEVPDSLVERQIYNMMADTHRRMSMRGMDPKVTAEFIPKLRDMYKEEAVQFVKTFLLIKSIAAKENITVDETEIDAYIGDIAQRRAQDTAMVKENLLQEGAIDHIRSELLSKKVMEFLESKADITHVSVKTAEGEGEK
jgi:trigger factor